MTKQNIIKELVDLNSAMEQTRWMYDLKKISAQEFYQDCVAYRDWFCNIAGDIIEYLETHRCYASKKEKVNE